MKKDCENCDTQFQAKGAWQKLCIDCYIQNKKADSPMSSTPSPTTSFSTPAAGSKDQTIMRLALLKVAAAANPGATAEQLVKYAQQLEEHWEKWE